MEELIKNTLNGDKHSFEVLIDSVKSDLYRVAQAKLKNLDDVNDAIQETIFKAFDKLHTLKEPKLFKTWIIRILINESNLIYKKNKKINIISFEEIENTKKINSPGMENVDIILDFNFICNQLKKEDRTIIILYYMDRFTDKEIGKILNLKENTVKTKRTRAMQKIKDIIEERRDING